MKTKDQVCTLEQAKRFKELGVTRIGLESEIGFYYWIGENPKDMLYYEESFPSTIHAVAAFTVAELTAMLWDFAASWRFKKEEEVFWIATMIGGKKIPSDAAITTYPECDRFGKTQAEALANLLISFIEVEHIKPEEASGRLK